MLRACCWVGMHVYGGDLGLCCVHAVDLLIMLFIEGLRSYCWVVMHGIKMFACLLLGCCARLFGCLCAYWWAVLHVYLWGYVHTARLFCTSIGGKGLCVYCWLLNMHVYLGVMCILLGIYAHLFGGLRACCLLVLHVYCWVGGITCILQGKILVSTALTVMKIKPRLHFTEW